MFSNTELHTINSSNSYIWKSDKNVLTLPSVRIQLYRTEKSYSRIKRQEWDHDFGLSVGNSSKYLRSKIGKYGLSVVLPYGIKMLHIFKLVAKLLKCVAFCSIIHTNSNAVWPHTQQQGLIIYMWSSGLCKSVVTLIGPRLFSNAVPMECCCVFALPVCSQHCSPTVW